MPRMDWLVLLHVLVAFAFVAGLVGRDITIAQARRPHDLTSITELLTVANRFDTIVKIGSIAVLVFGLLAMVVSDLSVSDNGWLVASLALGKDGPHLGSKSHTEPRDCLDQSGGDRIPGRAWRGSP